MFKVAGALAVRSFVAALEALEALALAGFARGAAAVALGQALE